MRSRVRGDDARGRPFGHQLAAFLAALRPEIEDPVCLGDHVKVVLDHHHRVPGIHQPVQNVHQLFDIGHG